MANLKGMLVVGGTFWLLWEADATGTTNTMM